jgi:hypothetical protein
VRGLPETQEERATSGGLNWFRGHTQREKNCHSGSEKATGRAKDGNESSQDRVTVLAGQGQPDWQADGALKPNDPAKTILQPKLTPSGRIDDFTCSLAGASVRDQVDYPLAMIDGHGFPNRPSQLWEVHNGGAGAGSGDRSSMDPRISSNSRR